MIVIPSSAVHITGIDSSLMVRRFMKECDTEVCAYEQRNCKKYSKHKWSQTAKDPICSNCRNYMSAMRSYKADAKTTGKTTPLLQDWGDYLKSDGSKRWQEFRRSKHNEREEQIEALYSSKQTAWLDATQHWFTPPGVPSFSHTQQPARGTSDARQSTPQQTNTGTDVVNDQNKSDDRYYERYYKFTDLDSTGQPFWDRRCERDYELNFLNKGSDLDV